MNGDQTLNIIIKAKDQASDTLDKFKGKLNDMQPAFQKMAAVGTAAFVAVSAVALKSVQAYAEVERANRQLEHSIISISKGTKAQVEEVEKLANALQKKAGVDADSVKMGVAQLSTFGLQSKSVIDLTKSLADLTVNQNGVNATGDQYIASANIMAKAMRGEFGMLQKMGIRFTEHQQELIKTGTETQKVAALQEGLAQNLRETTDTISGVDLASAKLHRTMEDIQENIGKALVPVFAKLAEKLQPIIDRFAEWADKNPELLSKIIITVGVISGLVAVIGLLGIALPGIIAGFTFLLSPIGLIVVAITAIIAGFIIFRDRMNEIMNTIEEKTGLITLFREQWDMIVTAFNENLLPALNTLWQALKPLEPILTLIGKIIVGVLVLAIKAIVLAISGWIQIITNIIALASEFAATIFNSFVKPIEAFINSVKSAIQWVENLINKMAQIGGKVGSSIKSGVQNVANKVGDFLGFEHGGTVPGAIGQAVPILAHGGETILPAGRSGNSTGTSIVLNINYPQFSNKDDVEVVKAQIDNALRDVIRIYKLQPSA